MQLAGLALSIWSAWLFCRSFLKPKANHYQRIDVSTLRVMSACLGAIRTIILPSLVAHCISGWLLCTDVSTVYAQSNHTTEKSRDSSGTLEATREMRLNEIQLIGTHNSYHIKPDEVARKFIASTAAREADAIEYNHRPLLEQLDALNLRHFELDLYLDPRALCITPPRCGNWRETSHRMCPTGRMSQP